MGDSVSLTSQLATQQAIVGASNAEARITGINNSQQKALGNLNGMPEKDVFEKDKKLALEKAQAQTELKIQEERLKAEKEKKAKKKK
jgi:hypothetical protein